MTTRHEVASARELRDGDGNKLGTVLVKFNRLPRHDGDDADLCKCSLTLRAATDPKDLVAFPVLPGGSIVAECVVDRECVDGDTDVPADLRAAAAETHRDVGIGDLPRYQPDSDEDAQRASADNDVVAERREAAARERAPHGLGDPIIDESGVDLSDDEAARVTTWLGRDEHVQCARQPDDSDPYTDEAPEDCEGAADRRIGAVPLCGVCAEQWHLDNDPVGPRDVVDVRVYQEVQVRGGPEEGGWYYTEGSTVRHLRVPSALAVAAVLGSFDDLGDDDELAVRCTPDVLSALLAAGGGVWASWSEKGYSPDRLSYVVKVGRRLPASYPARAPHYC